NPPTCKPRARRRPRRGARNPRRRSVEYATRHARMTGNPRLSVLVPVFNEVATVRTLLERVRAVRYPKELIGVDDCSKGGTRDVLEEFQRTTPDTPENRLVLVMHEHNQGKGAAIRTAAQHATGDIVIIQDADLEYDPNEYGKLIQPIVDG